MCGRFGQFCAWDVIAETFNVSESVSLAPRYNIAPSQLVGVIRVLDSRKGRRLDPLRWGLIPPWAKDPSLASRMINARAETVDEKPSFRAALARRRCVVPADGFYEWRKVHGGKAPYFIRMADRAPFAIAGLWERWENPEGEAVESCALITCEANGLLRSIHDRMPAILDIGDVDTWLDPGRRETAPLKKLLRPFPPERMEAYPVGREVNNPANDGPQLIMKTGGGAPD